MNWTDTLQPMPDCPALFAPEPWTLGLRLGFHIRRAGLGTWAAVSLRDLHVNPGFAVYQRWKDEIDEATTASMAKSIVGVIRQWQPVIPRDWIVTTPPAGASRGRPYPAAFLAKAVAALLDLDCLDTVVRDAADRKTCHGKLFALKQLPFSASIVPPSAALVVDDFINTGRTMSLTLAALRAAGCPAFGFSWGAA